MVIHNKLASGGGMKYIRYISIGTYSHYAPLYGFYSTYFILLLRNAQVLSLLVPFLK